RYRAPRALHPFPTRRSSDLRVRLIDASVITRPGSTGTDWRVHLSFDVGAGRVDGFDITDAHGGETLVRHPAAPDEIEVADRGYADRKSTRLNSSHVKISYAV